MIDASFRRQKTEKAGADEGDSDAFRLPEYSWYADQQ